MACLKVMAIHNLARLLLTLLTAAKLRLNPPTVNTRTLLISSSKGQRAAKAANLASRLNLSRLSLLDKVSRCSVHLAATVVSPRLMASLLLTASPLLNLSLILKINERHELPYVEGATRTKSRASTHPFKSFPFEIVKCKVWTITRLLLCTPSLSQLTV